MLGSKRSGRRKWTWFWFVLPSLLGVAWFVLLPFTDVVRRSFSQTMNGVFVGLQNYDTVLHNGAFLQAGGNTVRFVLICIPVLIVLSLLVALALYGHPQQAGVFKTTFLIPMAIPVASVVLLWKVLFHQNGLLSAFLDGLGLQGMDWMKTGFSFWVLVVSYIWKNLGYDMILWLAGLSGISPSLYEAAAVDGAGKLKCFTAITLPNLLPTLYTITVLSFLNSFKVFREAYLVAGDYPHSSMYLLQHLFNNWFADLDMDKLCAAAVLVGLIIFGLILLLRRAWEGEGEL
ncbi:carbohydrate ABC transporter permease [Harryflintia acetispora]|uniref:carbohydrate ABC transporter permease n=1 Tax=Harryflintia acetispora TaxID=1849041 RepID=UPI00189750EA|nr:sugar ABC transporter permease [Harryflintia acetispora]